MKKLILLAAILFTGLLHSQYKDIDSGFLCVPSNATAPKGVGNTTPLSYFYGMKSGQILMTTNDLKEYSITGEILAPGRADITDVYYTYDGELAGIRVIDTNSLEDKVFYAGVLAYLQSIYGIPQDYSEDEFFIVAWEGYHYSLYFIADGAAVSMIYSKNPNR